MKSTLKKKQIVWARTKGHPWWPGIITKVLDGQYAIDFIGDDSQQGSILMSDNLFDFQEKFDEFNDKGKKNKKLKEAIQNAQKLLKKLKDKQTKKQSNNRVTDNRSRRNLRQQFKKPDAPFEDNTLKSPAQEAPQLQQKKQCLDREFQDLLLLLIAAQLNYDQIKQKLTLIVDTIESQVVQNTNITDVLSERKGSILNAVYLILKHQSEQNPDHFFQRDIHYQITRLHELISKLKNQLLNQFFNVANIIQNLSEVCDNFSNEKRQVQVAQPPQQKQVIDNIPSQTKKKKKTKKIEKKQLDNQNQANLIISSNQNDYTNQNQQNQLKKEQILKEEAKIDEKQNLKEQNRTIIQDVQIQKKSQKKCEIPDQALRRKVCLNMLELVQLLGMEEEQAKRITIKIESLGREADPLMRNKYAKLMWYCIVNLDCQLLKREELLSLIDENAEQSEAWTKLTLQPIDRARKLIHI